MKDQKRKIKHKIFVLRLNQKFCWFDLALGQLFSAFLLFQVLLSSIFTLFDVGLI